MIQSKKYNIQLQDRDIEILKFINIFGYTFLKVIESTFFEEHSNDSNSASKRIKLLERGGYILLKDTEFRSYARAIFLTRKAKVYLHSVVGIDEDDIIKHKRLSSALVHQVAEQLAYYNLKKLGGTIERTTVHKFNKKLRHTPDFIYTSAAGLRMYIEIETSIKSVEAYNNIYKRVRETDDRYRPERIIYVLSGGVNIDTIAKKLPSTDSKISISLISLEEMIGNIKEYGQPRPKKLEDILDNIMLRDEEKIINLIQSEKAKC